MTDVPETLTPREPYDDGHECVTGWPDVCRRLNRIYHYLVDVNGDTAARVMVNVLSADVAAARPSPAVLSDPDSVTVIVAPGAVVRVDFPDAEGGVR